MLCPFGNFLWKVWVAVVIERELIGWGEVRAGLSPNGSEKQACRNQASSLWDEQG
jgi:hypothetical protein